MGHQLSALGARADQRHSEQMAKKHQRLAKVAATTSGRSRLDDMDAFLMSSSDEEDKPKKKDGGKKGNKASGEYYLL